jgi:hypothetical protein
MLLIPSHFPQQAHLLGGLFASFSVQKLAVIPALLKASGLTGINLVTQHLKDFSNESASGSDTHQDVERRPNLERGPDLLDCRHRGVVPGGKHEAHARLPYALGYSLGPHKDGSA